MDVFCFHDLGQVEWWADELEALSLGPDEITAAIPWGDSPSAAVQREAKGARAVPSAHAQ